MEKRGIPNWLQWVLVFVIAIGASLLIRRYVVEFYEVPSGSMLQTIQQGDHLIGEKVSLWTNEPQVGQIVTFNDIKGTGDTLIKRIIAGPGQTVDIKDNAVWVDGKKLDEPYTSGTPTLPLSDTWVAGGISYPLTVPEGQVWVMGDNRTDSLDSRYFGPIPISSITSETVWIYWPLNRWGALK